MSHTTQPSKHLVRDWLKRRAQELKPPPTPEEIRRQLGWGMMLLAPKAGAAGRT
ncbi:MAG: hypothetical protein ABW069_19500 [Duganella sp.]